MPQTCRTQLCLDIEDFRPHSAHAGRNFRMPQTSFLLLARGQQTGATQECAQASTGYCPAVPVVQKAQILCGTERMRGNARTALPGWAPTCASPLPALPCVSTMGKGKGRVGLLLRSSLCWERPGPTFGILGGLLMPGRATPSPTEGREKGKNISANFCRAPWISHPEGFIAAG